MLGLKFVQRENGAKSAVLCRLATWAAARVLAASAGGAGSGTGTAGPPVDRDPAAGARPSAGRRPEGHCWNWRDTGFRHFGNEPADERRRTDGMAPLQRPGGLGKPDQGTGRGTVRDQTAAWKTSGARKPCHLAIAAYNLSCCWRRLGQLEKCELNTLRWRLFGRAAVWSQRRQTHAQTGRPRNCHTATGGEKCWPNSPRRQYCHAVGSLQA